MTWFSADVEANGPVPGLYSMTSFSLVAIRHGLTDTFYAELRPLPGAGCDPEALAVAGMTMEYLEQQGEDPNEAMHRCAEWLKETSVNHPVFISDNNGFDFPFLAYYFALTGLENPFGHSSRRIGDLYSGLKGDARQATKWKSLRTEKHTHNALDDAKGNAGAILAIRELGLYVPGVDS